MVPRYKSCYSFAVRNVSEALWVVKQSLEENGVERRTRNGSAIEFPAPCAVTYNHPEEKVLFCHKRDANPFFHFMESLWMLSGRNDLDFVKKFNSNMCRYSDDQKTLHGAYGHRWRHHFNKDQLKLICLRLATIENDRRAVLTMWDPHADLLIENTAKDLPCNTHVYFSVRDNFLDMTVCNRSNDLIWGAFGANAVHMAFLQEYIAAMLNCRVGVYTQFTNNLHAYTDVLEKIKDMEPDLDPYLHREITPRKFVDNANVFDDELNSFLNGFTKIGYLNSIFNECAIPMQRAWEGWKMKDYDYAHENCEGIEFKDWRIACKDWLIRRELREK